MDIDRIIKPEAGVRPKLEITAEIEESMIDKAFEAAEKQKMEDATDMLEEKTREKQIMEDAEAFM